MPTRLGPTAPAPSILTRWMRDARQDVPHAIRSLFRSPGFALVSIITIGLGIGANAAVFSVVDRVLLRPLPYEASERIVRLWESRIDDPSWLGSVSVPNLDDWRRASHSFEALAAYSSQGMNLAGGASPERVQVVAAEPPLFRILRTPALLGRTLEASDGAAGHDDVVVVSEGFWERALGRRPTFSGRSSGSISVRTPWSA